ncbi:MAG: hypothetical protein EOP88_23010 [Verrucomicrobiaceae bacterium]|nr:MAG: hypothetical protein EOP88_23010 [Verrucomicrobiaceae bacterium]
MKPTLKLLLISLSLAAPLAAQDAAKTPDAFETGLREAFNAHKNGNDEATAAKLRELLKILEGKSVAKLGEFLPETLGAWKGEALVIEEPSTSGEGAGVSRAYVSGAQKIVVRVVKDYPKLGELLPMFVNEELLRLANRTLHKISDQPALMDGSDKLQLVVDERIYVEFLASGGAGETEMVALAGLLNIPAMVNIK